MPVEVKQAVDWALEQTIESDFGEILYVNEDGKVDRHLLVDFVRGYFNENDVEYNTFSYGDLEPYL